MGHASTLILHLDTNDVTLGHFNRLVQLHTRLSVVGQLGLLDDGFIILQNSHPHLAAAVGRQQLQTALCGQAYRAVHWGTEANGMAQIGAILQPVYNFDASWLFPAVAAYKVPVRTICTIPSLPIGTVGGHVAVGAICHMLLDIPDIPLHASGNPAHQVGKIIIGILLLQGICLGEFSISRSQLQGHTGLHIALGHLLFVLVQLHGGVAPGLHAIQQLGHRQGHGHPHGGILHLKVGALQQVFPTHLLVGPNGGGSIDRIAKEVLPAVVRNGHACANGGRVILQLIATQSIQSRAVFRPGAASAGIDQQGIFGDMAHTVGGHIGVVVEDIVGVGGGPCLPVLGAGGLPSVIDDVVFHLQLAECAAVGGDEGHALLHVEGVVVDFGQGAGGGHQSSPAVILADVVAEHRVHGLLQADHEGTAVVVMAVIVLVQSPIGRIGIKGLSVGVLPIVVVGVEHLVVLEHGIFALPGPHAGSHLAKGGGGVVGVVDLLASAVRHVVLHNGAVTVHGGDGIAARILDIVVGNAHVGVSVLGNVLIGDLSGVLEGGIVGGIGRSNAPTADVLDIAAVNEHIIVTGDSGFFLILRQKGGEVDAAVVHVLVVHIAIHILNIQIFQVNVVQSPLVLGYHSHTSAVHGIFCVVHRIGIYLTVGHGNVVHFDIGTVIEQNTAGHIPLVAVLGVGQRLAIILVPYPLPIGVDGGQLSFPVGINDDGSLGAAGNLSQVQIVIVELGATFQIHMVTRAQLLFAQGLQAIKSLPLAQSGIGVLTVLGADVIGLANRFLLGLRPLGKTQTYGAYRFAQ